MHDFACIPNLFGTPACAAQNNLAQCFVQKLDNPFQSPNGANQCIPLQQQMPALQQFSMHCCCLFSLEAVVAVKIFVETFFLQTQTQKTRNNENIKIHQAQASKGKPKQRTTTQAMGNFSSLESSQYVSDVIADRVATLVSDYLTPEKSIYLQQQMMIKNKDLTPALVQNVAPTTYITAKSTKEKTPTVQIPTFQDDDLLAAPLVFDIGSCNMRVGRAGFNNPFHTIRTVTGKLKVANQDRIFVGNDAISNKTISKVSCPIANGTVTDYESLSKIIAHGYDKLLTSDEIDSGAQPLLLSMKEQNKEMISRIAQCMFEEYNVPAMSFVHNGFASLVSEGYTSGVVVDVGHTSSNVVPIYEACTVQSNVGWTPGLSQIVIRLTQYYSWWPNNNQ